MKNGFDSSIIKDRMIDGFEGEFTNYVFCLFNGHEPYNGSFWLIMDISHNMFMFYGNIIT